MKILHVIPSVGPLRGGPSVAMRAVARGLAQAGLEVHVATTDDNGRVRLNVPHNVPVMEEGVAYWYFPRQTRFYTFSWPLTRWLAEHVKDYDLIHIHALFSYATLPAASCAARCGIPYIIRPLGTLNRWGMSNRHPWLKRLSFTLIERRILAGAAAVHYTSEQEQLEAAEWGVVKRSLVIPNAVDNLPGNYTKERDQIVRVSATTLNGVKVANTLSNDLEGRFRARYAQLAGRTIILFLSRLDPKKGLDLLLPAFAQLRAQNPDVALVLAGNGDRAFVTGLQHEAVRLGIAGDILWTDFLAGEEKWAALAGADVFVLPSYSENFGVAAVEAMAFGLPVVVSDQVGIHREIAEAQAGLVVRCAWEELARALTRLVRDEQLRSWMGRNAKRLAQTHFCLEAVTGKLINMYVDVTKSQPRG